MEQQQQQGAAARRMATLASHLRPQPASSHPQVRHHALPSSLGPPPARLIDLPGVLRIRERLRFAWIRSSPDFAMNNSGSWRTKLRPAPKVKGLISRGEGGRRSRKLGPWRQRRLLLVWGAEFHFLVQTLSRIVRRLGLPAHQAFVCAKIGGISSVSSSASSNLLLGMLIQLMFPNVCTAKCRINRPRTVFAASCVVPLLSHVY